MIRVMIVDDQALVRDGFRLIVDAQPQMTVVGEAADGQEAVAIAEACRPDVALMDVRSPGMDGIAATKILASRPDAPRICMLTTFDLDEHVYDAVRAGASGFLLKDVRARDLVHAIEVVASGQALVSPQLTLRLLNRFTQRPRPAAVFERFQVLTAREREVLVLVGHGLSNEEIAKDLFLSEATVRTHVSRVFAKLGLRDRVSAVVLAYDSGLVVPGEGTPAGRR